ncbi:MAG: hypothetical protein HY717_14585 [Planctomycetes bacterium]|nr:hypothetical protein [Planctomycetota bacterium]
MELLTVIAILAIIGGFSAGAYQYARRIYSLSAAASRAEGLLLSARHTAISWGIPVSVVVDPVSRSITAHAFESVGEWNFEESAGGSTSGVSGEPAELVGAEIVDGHVGKGVRLAEKSYVNCGSSSRFGLRAGLHVGAWISLEQPLAAPLRADSARGTRRRRDALEAAEEHTAAVVAKGKAFALGVTADGALEAAIGDYRVRTAPATVQPGRWTLAACQYDGKSITLFADELEREAAPVGYEGLDPKEVPPPPSSIPADLEPLTIGSPRGSIAARVDEVRLRGLVDPVVFALDPAFKILGWRKIIRFNRRGHLDPRFHERPVRLVFYEETANPLLKEARTQAVVDFSLTFQEWVEKSGRELEGLREEDEEKKIEERLGGRRKVEIILDRIGSVR